MTTQKARYSPAFAEQIQKISRELKEQNRRWPTFAAVSLLLGGIALLLLLGKHFDVPDSRTRAGLGILLIVSSCGRSERIGKPSALQPASTAKCCRRC